VPGLGEVAQMKQTTNRMLQVAQQLKPDLLHAHSPVLNAIPALRVGKQLGVPVVYEVRAFWEDAAVDHGSTTEGSANLHFAGTGATLTNNVTVNVRPGNNGSNGGSNACAWTVTSSAAHSCAIASARICARRDTVSAMMPSNATTVTCPAPP
jgi:hypothetical protein